MSIEDITFDDLSDIADESGAKRQKITSEQVATAAEDDAQIEAEKARKVAEEQAAKEQLKIIHYHRMQSYTFERMKILKSCKKDPGMPDINDFELYYNICKHFEKLHSDIQEAWTPGGVGIHSVVKFFLHKDCVTKAWEANKVPLDTSFISEHMLVMGRVVNLPDEGGTQVQPYSRHPDSLEDILIVETMSLHCSGSVFQEISEDTEDMAWFFTLKPLDETASWFRPSNRTKFRIFHPIATQHLNHLVQTVKAWHGRGVILGVNIPTWTHNVNLNFDYDFMRRVQVNKKTGERRGLVCMKIPRELKSSKTELVYSRILELCKQRPHMELQVIQLADLANTEYANCAEELRKFFGDRFVCIIQCKNKLLQSNFDHHVAAAKCKEELLSTTKTKLPFGRILTGVYHGHALEDTGKILCQGLCTSHAKRGVYGLGIYCSKSIKYAATFMEHQKCLVSTMAIGKVLVGVPKTVAQNEWPHRYPPKMTNRDGPWSRNVDGEQYSCTVNGDDLTAICLYNNESILLQFVVVCLPVDEEFEFKEV